MSAHLEFIVGFLDLVAFFLVAPEIIGPSRLVKWFKTGERSHWWIKSVWFKRTLYPENPFMLTLLAGCMLIALLALFGIEVPLSLRSLFFFVVFIVPVIFLFLYGSIARIAQPLGPLRALAIVGSIMFIVGRAIILTSAWSRL